MVNMDFSKRVVIDTIAADWQASPKAGVWRKPLAREEAERGHATSIVRYDPDSSFPEHDHPLGEEIYVLEGTFSDHTGDYRAGTYFRNPPGFVHAPFSDEGCIILVKLHQFQPDDTHKVTVQTAKAAWHPVQEGLEALTLHEFRDERVSLVRAVSAQAFPEHTHDGGEEIYVIEGEAFDEHGSYAAGSWMRYPRSSSHRPGMAAGTLLWVKQGRLPA